MVSKRKKCKGCGRMIRGLKTLCAHCLTYGIEKSKEILKIQKARMLLDKLQNG